MMFVINPGSGPVASARLSIAWKNIRKFRRDLVDAALETGYKLGPAPAWPTIERSPKGDERGRYDFILRCGRKRVEVSMPGIELEKVRYLGTPDQNAWDYPRLYVDGSSWLWEFALSQAREALCRKADTPSQSGA